jgi:sugar phosphate isomerase/epimerase
MKRLFSLAHLTVLGCTPPEMTYIAARTGYDFVSLRLIPMGVPGEQPFSPADKAMIRKTKIALEETGVKVLDLELARILADQDPKTYLAAMEAGAELGARHVIASAWTTDRSDRHFIVDRYAELCDLAKPFRLTVDLEFPTFSRLTTLQEAADIVRAADRSNCGILIDTLYLHFSRVGLDQLTALPRHWLHFIHLCDTSEEIPATRDGMIQVARNERLYVGEGRIDFAAILGRLPAIPLAIELPNAKQVKKVGYEGHARRCLETAKQYMERLEPAQKP